MRGIWSFVTRGLSAPKSDSSQLLSGAEGFDLCFPLSAMDSRPHPFPAKLTDGQAEEVRRLRRGGAPLAELAEKFGVAKSSLSRVIHLKSHAPLGTLRIALPTSEQDLLREIAEDEEVPVEEIAADLLVEMLRSRQW